MNKLILTLMISFTSSLLFASEISWMKWDEAQKVAAQTQKIILIKVTQDNCRYCIRMENYVLANKEVQAFINKHFVPVAINKSHESLPLHLYANMAPTFFFVSPDQKVLKKVPGAWGKHDFMDLLKSILPKEDK